MENYSFKFSSINCLLKLSSVSIFFNIKDLPYLCISCDDPESGSKRWRLKIKIDGPQKEYATWTCYFNEEDERDKTFEKLTSELENFINLQSMNLRNDEGTKLVV
jgi:hypothetical protein